MGLFIATGTEVETLQINLLTALGGAGSFAGLAWWLSTRFNEVLNKISELARSVDDKYASKDSQQILRKDLLEKIAETKAETDKLAAKVQTLEIQHHRNA